MDFIRFLHSSWFLDTPDDCFLAHTLNFTHGLCEDEVLGLPASAANNQMNDNLYAIIESCFPTDRSCVLLETDARAIYTYSDFALWTGKYAAWLASKGVRPGDRVLAQTDKSPHLLMLCYACIRMGAIFVPLNPTSRRGEIQVILEDADPRMAICHPRRREEYESLRKEMQTSFAMSTMDVSGYGEAYEEAKTIESTTRIEDCSGSDVAALMYTSGTTGRPKGAMITHRNLYANGAALREFWRWRSSEVLLHSLPLYHLHGLFVATVPTLLSGSRIILHRRFLAPAILAALPHATIFMGVPTYYTRLLKSPLTRESCGNIRLFISGSAPLREQTFREFEQRTGHAIVERYGMTETGGIASSPVDGQRIGGSVGLPLPGFDLRIADAAGQAVSDGVVGEVLIRGESVFPGYWRRPAETAEAFSSDGFFRSGDLGRRLANGAYAIAGRAKDLIITGGMNVNPKEIEITIDAYPGVMESAVIGVPHPDYGEAVVAIVVLDSRGAASAGEVGGAAELLSWLKREIAGYKIPRKIFIVKELPRNAMGKVQKNLLRSDPRFEETFRGLAAKDISKNTDISGPSKN
ncbi:MAG: malonyl-CoA synthase [Acidobacteria bacterium]|nr:malonyl-CoA synthase [Acidobacteriota bacterium]